MAGKDGWRDLVSAYNKRTQAEKPDPVQDPDQKVWEYLDGEKDRTRRAEQVRQT
jgi:hypothetical protein